MAFLFIENLAKIDRIRDGNKYKAANVYFRKLVWTCTSRMISCSPLDHLRQHILLYFYSVFFFMPKKVNANFTYLYLIEINAWCLIFSSMFGHLIIYKEIQILIIMWLVKLKNLKLVGFQFCRVESKIYCYTKLSIWSHWGI